MKVLIATPLYPPEIGGPATYTTMLERELPARNIEVTTLPFSTVRRYPRGLRHLAYSWKLFWASRHADIVHVLDPVSVGVPAYLVHRLCRVPYVLRVSGDYAWERAALGDEEPEPPHEFVVREGHDRVTRLLQAVQARVARRACAITTPSRYLKDVIAAWGVDDERITVVYNPGPQPQGSAARATARAALGYDDRTPLVVTAGRCIPLKRFDGVIDAFTSVREHVSDARLAVVGDGPLLPVLKEQAGMFPAGAVNFPGRVDAGTMQQYLAAADVFVLNSTHETFPHMLLEAIAAGAPVVACPVGGNPEIIKSAGAGGVLVPSGDTAALAAAITRLLVEPGYASQVRERASATLERFRQSGIIEQIAPILVDAAAPRS